MMTQFTDAYFHHRLEKIFFILNFATAQELPNGGYRIGLRVMQL